MHPKENRDASFLFSRLEQTRLVGLEKQGSSVPRGIMNEIKMNFTVPKIDDNKDNSAFEEVQFVGVEEREKVEEIVAK